MPLSKPALAIIEGLPRVEAANNASDLVFTTNGKDTDKRLVEGEAGLGTTS